jgi:predicted acetyltransferase
LAERVELTVEPVRESERDLVARLLQLYLYDFSEIEPADVGSDGLFYYRWLPFYWTEPERHAFLFRVDGEPAGFALVRAGDVTELAEFFVLRRHRSAGIGRTAAAEVFARFPGRWSVSQTPNNAAATRFWRRSIPVPFEESVEESGRRTQRFEIPGPTPA